MCLVRLSERADDSDTALGSGAMSAALEGQALLRISGRNQGLESLRDALSARFAGRRRTPAPAETPATGPVRPDARNARRGLAAVAVMRCDIIGVIRCDLRRRCL